MEKPQKILVWSISTRVFHWSLALSFLGAMLTGDSDYFHDLHIAFGYTMLGLIGYRVFVGFFGNRYQKFSALMYPFNEAVGYIKATIKPPIKHYTGHNPAGAWAMILMLILIVVSAVSGIIIEDDWVSGFFEEVFEELHEGSSNIILLIVGIHIIGAIVSSFLHKENLPMSMWHGHKNGKPSEAITKNQLWVAILIALSICANFAYLLITRFF